MEDLFLAPCWKHVRHSGRGDQWTWARFRVKSYNRPNKGKGLAAGGTSCTHIPFQPKQSSHWLHLSWERIKNPAVTYRVPGKKAEHSSFGKKKETKAMECYQSLSVSSLFLLTWLYGSWWDKTLALMVKVFVAQSCDLGQRAWLLWTSAFSTINWKFRKAQTKWEEWNNAISLADFCASQEIWF